MGFKTPLAWKDELYRNELRKLDFKREIMKMEETGVAKVGNEFKGEMDKLESSYFDRVYQENCQNMVRAKTAQKVRRK